MSKMEKPATETRRCRRNVRMFAVGLLFAVSVSSSFAQRAVILVRHAEKADASGDTALSDAGKIRAARLAQTLARVGITAVFCSEYLRTRQTADPLAAALKLPVQPHPAADPAGLVKKIRARHANDVVLIVGHSNTVPEILEIFGHPVLEPIEDDDYGSLFILIPESGQYPLVIRFKY